MMIEFIYGSIWGMICFLIGCVLTFIVTKYYDSKVKVEKVPVPSRVKEHPLLDPVMPRIMRKPDIDIDDDEEDDEE